jgi:hypothetical protein
MTVDTALGKAQQPVDHGQHQHAQRGDPLPAIDDRELAVGAALDNQRAHVVHIFSAVGERDDVVPDVFRLFFNPRTVALIGPEPDRFCHCRSARGSSSCLCSVDLPWPLPAHRS